MYRTSIETSPSHASAVRCLALALVLTAWACSGDGARPEASSEETSGPTLPTTPTTPSVPEVGTGSAGSSGRGPAGDDSSGASASQAGAGSTTSGAAAQSGSAGAAAPGPGGDSGAGGDSGDSEPSAAGDGSAGEEPSDAGVPAAADAAAPEAPVVSCPAAALPPGESRASLMHDGRTREFLIYVPSGYDNTRPVPLVLNFHGATMTADQQRDFSGMNATADAKGFIVVYPQGVGNTWNAGVCCGEAQSSNVDDVGFARALLASMQEKACIDPRRVYSAGFSNGGRMSYRLGCEATELFAAIAPVAGTKSFPDDANTPGCQPSRPISLIDIMGSADPRSAAQPGQIAEWVAFNACSDAAPTESYRQGAHVCSTYSQCKDATSVTYCVVDGGDHCWPGSYPCILGNTSRPEELSANELIWELFERSTR